MSHIQDLENQIRELERELHEERSRCHHTRVTYKEGAADGDPWSRDQYWKDIVCLDCGFKSHIDSDINPTDYNFRGALGSVLHVPNEKYAVYNEVKKLIEESDEIRTLY